MKRFRLLVAAFAAALLTAVPFSACGATNSEDSQDRQIGQELVPDTQTPDDSGLGNGEYEANNGESGNGNSVGGGESQNKPQPELPSKPATAKYFTVTSDGVNIRAGAGTGYSVRGQAEKSTLYCLSGQDGDWYKTGYRNNTAYLSTKYCKLVELPASDNQLIESVIEEGCKLLGTPYVYGAVRLHDGSGKLLKNFTTNEFDCSSLMQYIFYKGADKLLQVNTRTQVYQGKTVTKAQLQRGDLMFFTNAERKNKTGVERVGHVALYLGDNYILHTASDYAKIEQISSLRWSYFIQGQRII